MVTAPKCKVCGAQHFGPAHVWSGPAPKAEPVPLKAPPKKRQAIPDGIALVSMSHPQTGPTMSPKEKRAARKRLLAATEEIEAPPSLVAKIAKRDRAAYMRAYRAKKGKR